MLKSSYKNNQETDNAKGIFLVYCESDYSISVNFIFIIIITKRNNTVIAPIYIKI